MFRNIVCIKKIFPRILILSFKFESFKNYINFDFRFQNLS